MPFFSSADLPPGAAVIKERQKLLSDLISEVTQKFVEFEFDASIVACGYGAYAAGGVGLPAPEKMHGSLSLDEANQALYFCQLWQLYMASAVTAAQQKMLLERGQPAKLVLHLISEGRKDVKNGMKIRPHS